MVPSTWATNKQSALKQKGRAVARPFFVTTRIPYFEIITCFDAPKPGVDTNTV